MITQFHMPLFLSHPVVLRPRGLIDGDGSAYLHSFFSAIVASYLSPRPMWKERE